MEDALAAVQAGFDVPNEMSLYDGRLHEKRGEILLQQGADDDAERCFHCALEIAREREEKSPVEAALAADERAAPVREQFRPIVR